jgi:two-component sensor histidine kinase
MMVKTRSMYIGALGFAAAVTPIFLFVGLWISDDAIFYRRNWTLVLSGLSCILASVAALVTFVHQRRRHDAEAAALALLSQTQGALEERNVLLREIYHRVKNNLQVIQSLLRLSSNNLSAEQKIPFEDAITRIGAMAKVHTMLYRSDDLKTVDAGEFVRDIAGEIMGAYCAPVRGISLHVEAERDIRVSLDNASPLAFVTVELMTNALKHAFEGRSSGRVTVEICVRDGMGWLCVSDDGIGVPADFRKRRSLGLRMTDRLVEQLGGKIQWPEPGESRFCLSFQLNVGEAEAARIAFASAPLPSGVHYPGREPTVDEMI